MAPNVPRSVDSGDCNVMVEDLPNGKFLLTLHAGPISMRASIPAEALAFLFDLPVARGSAGIVPLMAVSGKDAA